MDTISRCADGTTTAQDLRRRRVETFERDGYATIEGALSPREVAALTDAVDRTWTARRDAPPSPGSPPLHLLAFAGEADPFIELVDHEAALSLVVDVLGWNVFVHHCHLDVHPPVTGPARSAWMWHQDGGVQNRDLGTAGPRMSVKVAFFLTDLSEPGRGNFVVVPGSHLGPALRRPADDDNDIPGAVPILARPGTAVLFDRRLWHMRSENRGPLTRKALFYAYTYRWVRPRDDLVIPPERGRAMTPVRAQLLGAGASVIGHWFPEVEDAPLQTRYGLGASSYSPPSSDIA
jgi:ectoine hydroxylase